jgi:ion channel-forming bestrophin family protein
MYVGNRFNISVLWPFAWKNLLITLLISTAACLIFHFGEIKFIAIPFLPVGTIGTAVAFFVGFKNNQAYDRLWEARRLWGGFTNTSRSFAAAIVALVPDKTQQREILIRHIAYLNILRLQLRRHIPWATSRYDVHRRSVSEAEEFQEFDKGLKDILTANNKMQYYEFLRTANNAAGGILKVQIGELTRLKREKVLDDFEHSDLVKHINELYNLQGGCERIKTTPLFRQYSIFSRVFVKIFIVLLPFGLLKDLNNLADWGVWLTIPFSMLISWVFFTMEQVGEYSENPFDNSINDTPITTICRNIEIDIKEMMGDTELPPKINPHDNVLL